jgi:hypothetical protein
MSSLVTEAGQDSDIRRAATFMVERYGRIAAARAARRACVLLLAGYSRAAAIWTSIADLAEQLAAQIAPQPIEAVPAVNTNANVIPFRIRSPYPSGRVRPSAPSSTGRRVAVGRLIPSLSPSVGAPRVPSPLRP